MVAVTRIFRDVLDGGREPQEALAALATLYPVPFANGFLHAVPGAERTRQPA